jgi:hypothetical protein
MINTKRTITSLKIVCDEKEAPWMQIAFHYKARFGIMRMLVKTFQGLDLYLVVD